MAKFNLETLAKCGAKTRSGKPCQRYGNKTNGRCKLHGGRSTGAKTKEGKLAVRVNALLNNFMWFCNSHFYMKISKSDMERAIKAYLNLVDLTNLKYNELQNQVIDIVREYRVELETAKYYIEKYEGPEAFVIIQSALDHYYKDNANEHLHFHIYTPIYPTPFYHRFHGSKAEDELCTKMLVKTIRKKGCFYSGRVYPSPMRKELKKRLKDFKEKHT
ncbi:HGGxSTG domain-containing protein [Shewanella kaireitica]|uniref:HGGxSTG domain-containing protein n=1 Tax=Shewanella kaireitica TaxID=212021 RepID=UPI0020105D47|nr:HGGxSTG domain-containing protein [Shewanella kaireitica]MCL1095908.1 hypothetical protein [Shewanella kaireitica]